MSANPIMGVLYHWIGGLAAASFYIPYRQVKRWSWETYWLVGGIFSWIVMPALMASILVPGFWSVLNSTPHKVLMYAYLFGALWGIGGLTFGLTMRYLGIALGMSVALGYTAIFGTLIPPIAQHQIGKILSGDSGHYIILGVLVSFIGIAVSGLAGMSKEKELTPSQKTSTITEFHFGKGMLIATFSGIMSSCMAFGLDAGTPINKLAVKLLHSEGGSSIWQGLPVLVIVLLGGFTTNFIWCAILSFKHRSTGEYAGKYSLGENMSDTGYETEFSAAEAISPLDTDELKERSSLVSKTLVTSSVKSGQQKNPLLNNYLFAALAGILWYLQFFFYQMGQAQLGKAFIFANWTIHMSSIMIFSMLWGIALKEWRGTSSRTHKLIAVGLFLLVSSTVIIGYANKLTG